MKSYKEIIGKDWQMLDLLDLPDSQNIGEKVLVHRVLNEGQKSMEIGILATNYLKYCNADETKWIPLPDVDDEHWQTLDLTDLPKSQILGEKVLVHRVTNEGQKATEISILSTNLLKYCNPNETKWMPLPTKPE